MYFNIVRKSRSHRKYSVKKGVCKNLSKFGKIHRKTPLPEPLCNFIRKGALVKVFSCEFCKIFTNLKNYSRFKQPLYTYGLL